MKIIMMMIVEHRIVVTFNNQKHYFAINSNDMLIGGEDLLSRAEVLNVSSIYYIDFYLTLRHSHY
jgi:hypothetical protein